MAPPDSHTGRFIAGWQKIHRIVTQVDFSTFDKKQNMVPPDSQTDRFIRVWLKAEMWLNQIATWTGLSKFGLNRNVAPLDSQAGLAGLCRKQENDATGLPHR